MEDLVQVPLADGTNVYLRPKLGLASGIAVQKLIIDANNAEGRTSADLTGALAEAYLLYGVAAWDYPEPVTPESIRTRLLEDFAVGEAVADVADDLYMAAVLLPLVKRGQKSSPTTPTNGSTSATRNGSSKSRKRSKPSSTTTTQTGVTETTSLSLVGASSS